MQQKQTKHCFNSRDIKPENFVLGLKDGDNFNMIYMIDFGLAITYVDIRGKNLRYTVHI
jgi:serine/threonine protein kinase